MAELLKDNVEGERRRLEVPEGTSSIPNPTREVSNLLGCLVYLL